MRRLVFSLSLPLLAILACSSEDDGSRAAPPLESPDAGVDGASPPGPNGPPILDDGGPGCGRRNQSCCVPPVKPASWSHDGEVCMPGYRCESGLCRPTELGQKCEAETDCPSGICLPTGTTTKACTLSCAAAEDCTPGWTCTPEASVGDSVCRCTASPEACNGKDDDCNGAIDDGDGAGCATGTQCCAAGCHDVSKDPQHCGSCGHDCGGGTCTNGMCDPVVVTETQLRFPYAYTADSKSVYFAANTTCAAGSKTLVQSCSVYNCTQPTTLFESACAQSPLFVVTMATDPSTTGAVYWATSPTESSGLGAIAMAPTGAPVLTTLGSVALQRVTALAVDPAEGSTPTKLYFGDVGGNIRRCIPTSCATTIETLVVGQAPIASIALDGTSFFFGTRDNNRRGIIGSCPKNGCINGAPRVISSDENSVQTVAAAGGRVFWTNQGDPNTFQTNKALSTCLDVAGCTPARRTSERGPTGLVVDRSHVYWTAFADGVWKAPLSDIFEGTKLAGYNFISAGLVPLATDGDKMLVYQDEKLRRVAK